MGCYYTRCGAAVVAAMRGWWRRGVGCDEVMMGTVMWYGVDGDGAAVDLWWGGGSVVGTLFGGDVGRDGGDRRWWVTSL
ncbi:hypothetical protein Tco_0621940 [Tanacetum coccineum]